jgi:tetratricopeptide (TPR) repeat protein
MRHSHTSVIVSALLMSAWLVAVPLWAQASDADRAIALAQRKLKRHAHDPTAYLYLGDAYIQKARESGDLSYYERAEQALRTALDLAPGHSGVIRHLAHVFSARHDFQAAATAAAKAIALDPNDSQAYGVLGDAYLEIGQYEQAAHAYQRMLALHADLASYSRLSGWKNLQGDPEGAIADLERAIQAGQAAGQPRESIAWAQWQLGSEHLGLGRLHEAETQYRAALATYPHYYRATAGLAHVRVAQQRYDEAIVLYQQAMAVIPLPEYATALGDVYTKLGRREEAHKQYALVEYIGLLSTLNNVVYNRELAYFYSDHDIKLPEALALARKELESRQDIYAYDLLAWALYKNDRPQEALAAMTEALQLGTRDARLLFHAGMIHQRLGNTAQAQDYLRRALATNPHFHIIHADLAHRILQQLAERPDPEPLRERHDAQ